MQGWIQAGVMLGILGGTLWGVTRWFEWSRVYRPRRLLERTPAEAGLSYEEVFFVAEDATLLHGWWIPSSGAPGTVMYCHGNGDNIGDLIDVAEDVQALGWNLFLWDYRGYGNSRGIPTEQGTYRDARAAFEVVRARHDGADDPPVLVIGRSLGGAVAVHLALDKPVRGLVLESTFTSTSDVGRRWYPNLPVRWIIRYRYDSLEKIKECRIPVLVAHSPQDETIPFEQGRALFEAAPGPKRFVPLHGSHLDGGWRQNPVYRNAVAALAREVLGRPPM